MVFGEPGVSGCHAQSLAAAQITAGVEFVIFPIRRTKVTIAISTNQMALRQGYVVKILAQVISISGEYSSKIGSFRCNIIGSTFKYHVPFL